MQLVHGQACAVFGGCGGSGAIGVRIEAFAFLEVFMGVCGLAQ